MNAYILQKGIFTTRRELQNNNLAKLYGITQCILNRPRSRLQIFMGSDICKSMARKLSLVHFKANWKVKVPSCSIHIFLPLSVMGNRANTQIKKP